ncbi:hypothetical protein MMC28_003737 [Mycoblastus sanguinarius]|nr:hypothetical protein [Mycoblastus sanguinarius]
MTIHGLNSYIGSYYSSTPGWLSSTANPTGHLPFSGPGSIKPVSAGLALADTKIALGSPFIYFPPKTASDDLMNISSVATNVFGYVPQTLIYWMKQDPVLMAKYPQLSSCLTGGALVTPLSHPNGNVAPIPTATNYFQGIQQPQPGSIQQASGPEATPLPAPSTQLPGCAAQPEAYSQQGLAGTQLPGANSQQVPGLIQGIPAPQLTLSNGGVVPNPAATNINTVQMVPLVAGQQVEGGPGVNAPATDLTTSSVVTVSSSGCFNPEACPVSEAPSTTLKSTALAKIFEPGHESQAHVAASTAVFGSKITSVPFSIARNDTNADHRRYPDSLPTTSIVASTIKAQPVATGQQNPNALSAISPTGDDILSSTSENPQESAMLSTSAVGITLGPTVAASINEQNPVPSMPAIPAVSGSPSVPGRPGAPVVGDSPSGPSLPAVPAVGGSPSVPGRLGAPAVGDSSPPISDTIVISTGASSSHPSPNTRTIGATGSAVVVSPTGPSAARATASTPSHNIAFPYTTALLPPIVLESQTFTADDSSAYVIDGQTLLPVEFAVKTVRSVARTNSERFSNTGLGDQATVYTPGSELPTTNPTALPIGSITNSYNNTSTGVPSPAIAKSSRKKSSAPGLEAVTYITSISVGLVWVLLS